MKEKSSDEKRSLEVAESAREAEWKKPSFVGELFMGRLKTDLVFPFPEQDPADRKEGDDVLDKLGQFLEKNVDADQIDREKDIPQDVIEGLRELGLFGIKIDGKYGGLGLSQTNYNRIIQLIASHCASTAVTLSAHQSIGVPQPLKMFGSEKQKKTYLPRLARGEFSAFALTEPEVGSDPSRMMTTAVQADNGSDWIINGEKLWITNGVIADLLVVMARTNDPQEDRPEITAFIVEGKSDGLTAEHRCDFMGLKGIQNGLLKFDNVRVPATNILGEQGGGLRLALQTLNTGRLTLPAACGGAMKQTLAQAVRWSQERRQWGAPVGHHEAVGSKIATLAAEIFAVESLTWLTSAMADNEDLDIRLEAAMAKLFCTEALWRAVDAGVQIRGGRGYETADSLRSRGETGMPMERLMRDARINLIIEGTSEIMRLFIAREALDPHLKIAGMNTSSDKMDLTGALKFYSRWYPALWLPKFNVSKDLHLPGSLGKHLRFVERGVRRLARDLFHAMVLYRQGLQQKQQLLARLVDSGAELFAMAAAVSRAASPQAESNARELADLFCRQARRRLQNLHRAVYCNDDRVTYRTARKILDGNYTWLEKNIIMTWKEGSNRS